MLAVTHTDKEGGGGGLMCRQMSEWCTSEIVQLDTPDRVACIEWFIDLIEVYTTH